MIDQNSRVTPLAIFLVESRLTALGIEVDYEWQMSLASSAFGNWCDFEIISPSRGETKGREHALP